MSDQNGFEGAGACIVNTWYILRGQQVQIWFLEAGGAGNESNLCNWLFFKIKFKIYHSVSVGVLTPILMN